MINRREYIRRILVFALVAVCAVLIAFVLFYDRLSPTTEVIEDVVMEADVSLSAFNYTETVDGITQWTLVADSAAHDFTSEQSLLQNLNMRLYNQEQFGDVVLTAQTGKALLSNQQVTAEGDVVIVTDNGYQLVTDSLIYRGMDSLGGVVVAKDKVQITSAQLQLSGAGLTLDIAKKAMKLERDVVATFYPNAEKGEL